MYEKYRIEALDEKSAELIAECWRYPEPYEMYNADRNRYRKYREDSEEKKHYFQVTADGILVGYFHVEKEDRFVNLNFKMKPELCGQGRGKQFLNAIEKYIHRYQKGMTIVGDVLSFDERALTLLKHMGYAQCGYAELKNYPAIRYMKKV